MHTTRGTRGCGAKAPEARAGVALLGATSTEAPKLLSRFTIGAERCHPLLEVRLKRWASAIECVVVYKAQQVRAHTC